jgi:mono/diheme cytochrome c family protein
MQFSGNPPTRRAAAAAGLVAVALLAAHPGARADAAADRAYCESLKSPSAKVACLRDVRSAPAAVSPAAVKPTADTGTAPAAKPTAAPQPAGSTPYKVVDGTKVDAFTLKGFHTWRSAACDRCHGANQEGMVGPSLIDSLKTLTKEQFVATVTQGRLEKGMPSFGQNPTVKDNIDALYAYLKGRSDGAITKAKVQPME